MEKNIQSPALSIEQSFSNQKDLRPEESTGVVVVGLSLGALIRRIGLLKAIRSRTDRYRYTLKLWLLREIYLWKALNDKFEQIPANTKEKRLLSLVRKFPILRRAAVALEKRLNKRLIADPYQPSLTINSVKIRKKRRDKFSLDDLKRANQFQQVAESFNNQTTF